MERFVGLRRAGNAAEYLRTTEAYNPEPRKAVKGGVNPRERLRTNIDDFPKNR
jgi:hypothetical protein